MIVVDPRLQPLHSTGNGGIPSRARISPSGRKAAWTSFATGDSYAAATEFSTRTGVIDTATGEAWENIEDLALTWDGRAYEAADVNYWGLSFAPDDDTFYATVKTKGSVHLVRGSVSGRSATVIADDVECPSLSPDGTRIVYKRPSPDLDPAWRLHVLDLATMTDVALAETAGIDDQAVWLGDGTIAYGRDGNVWTVPADGGGAPSLLLRDAASPSLVP
ncbi:hypothetical protein AB0I28_13265 [Phytomonospora sp. NPDC050363]|uniref:hypothetical protein n=1 Tax=Phytomonospora sp. NPDC050363 TaxID=3155642 RepID=UPI0033D10D4B